MWIKKEKPSKLLLILSEYFGCSILFGIVGMLFFMWATRVAVYHYSEVNQIPVSGTIYSWIQLICVFAGVFLALFLLILLLQEKFGYMVEISAAVEAMETGNLSKRIPIKGDDELGDLAASINRLAQAMADDQARSEALNDDKMQTVATLSHDIRTPLTSVMSYLQLIRDRKYTEAEQLEAYAERAYEKALRIKDMTDDLFEACVAEEQRGHHLERVDGGRFLEQVLYEIESFLRESGFEVSISKPAETAPFFLMIDRANLSRVFDNVLSNIEKYADRRFPIALRAKSTDGWLILQQENHVIEERQKRKVTSHLLGLRGVERMLEKAGGALRVCESDGIFQLEIKLPVS